MMLTRFVSVALGLAALAAPLAAQDAQQVHAPPPEQFTVRSGDVLRIKVWPDETLSGEYPVGVSGNVYLPIVGEFHAAGLGLAQLQDRIRGLYGESMKNPVISVTPLFPVSVFGGVRSPGVFATDPTQTLVDVIARAGGFTDRAKPDDIRIIRRGVVLPFNARAMLNGGDDSSIVLQSGDRIYVPQRSGISFSNFAMAAQLLLTAAVLARQFTH